MSLISTQLVSILYEVIKHKLICHYKYFFHKSVIWVLSLSMSFTINIFNVVRYIFYFMVSWFSNLLIVSFSLDCTQGLLDIKAIFCSVLLFTMTINLWGMYFSIWCKVSILFLIDNSYSGILLKIIYFPNKFSYHIWCIIYIKFSYTRLFLDSLFHWTISHQYHVYFIIT